MSDKDPILALCAKESPSDIGNGKRFRLRYGDLTLDGKGCAAKVVAIGWFCYDGTRWSEDPEEALVRGLAHETAMAIAKESVLIEPNEDELAIIHGGDVCAGMLADDLASMTDDQRAALVEAVEASEEASASLKKRRDGRRAFGLKSQASGSITAMLREAQPYLSRTVDDLNQDRLAFNCASGTIRFLEPNSAGNPFPYWTASLDRHEPADMITKRAGAQWFPVDPERHRRQGNVPTLPPDGYSTATPVFDGFLETVLPNPDIREFLQRFFGYCLLGLTSEQVLAFFYGRGRNGKSTLMDVISRAMGDYNVQIGIESLSGDRQRGGADATPDLARLPGARLVASSEPESGSRLKAALIKTLTGGERFPVRRLHRDFFEIDPQFKMVISGNHKPIVDDDSDGTWRRLLLVPWDVQIPREEIDVGLPCKLRAEIDGVLAWMVEGALRYLDNYDLAVPEAVRAASSEFRTDSDPLLGFITEACTVTGKGDSGDEKVADLYASYEKWCTAVGQFAYRPETFHRRLAAKAGMSFPAPDGTARTFQKSKSNGQTVYRGIVIRAEWRADTSSGGRYAET